MTSCHRKRESRIANAATALAILLLSGFVFGLAPAYGQSATPSTQQSDHSGSGKATFGIGPAGAHRLDQRHNFTYSGTAGGVVRDHVGIVNVGSHPLSLVVYATDGLNGDAGALGLQLQSTPPVDVGAWVSLALPDGGFKIIVPARRTVVVPFSVHIPSNAQPGDHVGGIVVSLISRVTNGTGINGRLEQRVGVPMFIRVSGPLNPELSIEDLGVEYHPNLDPFGAGSATVTYRVRNTGNVELSGIQRVSVTGLFGTTATANNVANLPLLLPGGSATMRITVPGDYPEFLEKAHVNIQPLGRLGDVDPSLVPVVASAQIWAVPWLLLLITVGVAMALLVIRRFRRRGKGPKSPLAWQEGPTRSVSVGGARR